MKKLYHEIAKKDSGGFIIPSLAKHIVWLLSTNTTIMPDEKEIKGDIADAKEKEATAQHDRADNADDEAEKARDEANK